MCCPENRVVAVRLPQEWRAQRSQHRAFNIRPPGASNALPPILKRGGFQQLRRVLAPSHSLLRHRVGGLLRERESEFSGAPLRWVLRTFRRSCRHVRGGIRLCDRTRCGGRCRGNDTWNVLDTKVGGRGSGLRLRFLGVRINARCGNWKERRLPSLL